MNIIAGVFYEFHAERVISRPGQPLDTRTGFEIGPQISMQVAAQHVGTGKDVYTLAKEDAYRLAVQVSPGEPALEEPHHPRQPSPTGRMDVYFRHYHPGGDHENYGHIFFGRRGEAYTAQAGR